MRTHPLACAQSTTSSIAATPQPAGFSGNPKAIRLLRELERQYDVRELVYVDLVCTRSVSDENGRQEITTSTGTYWRKQRDKVVWISDGPARPWTVISDGKKVLSCLVDEKQYTLSSYGPRRLDSAVFGFSGEYGVFLTHLICSSMRGSEPVTFVRGEDFGMEEVLGSHARHVRLGAGAGIVDVWLNDDGLPVHVMETLQQDRNYTTLVLGLKWKEGQPIPEHSFSVVPPEDFRMVDFFEVGQ